MLISLMLLFSMQVDDPNSFELNEDLQVTEVNSASDSEDRWILVWSVQTKQAFKSVIC